MNISSLLIQYYSILIPFLEFRTSIDKYNSISEVRNVWRINELCRRLSNALFWKSFSRNMAPRTISAKWMNSFKLYISVSSLFIITGIESTLIYMHVLSWILQMYCVWILSVYITSYYIYIYIYIYHNIYI